MRKVLLFDLPKLKRLKRMHVVDAGPGCIMFECKWCGHSSGWLADIRTITENKRGLPCPKCNDLTKDTEQ